MKRNLVLAAALLSSTAAFADAYDYTLEATTVEVKRINLCEHKAVVEVARIDRELKPVKELYEIATNPTGYAIKVVSREIGVKIPAWVDYAIDPQGAIRAKVIKEVRKELKRNVGLEHDCAAQLDEATQPEEVPAPAEEA